MSRFEYEVSYYTPIGTDPDQPDVIIRHYYDWDDNCTRRTPIGLNLWEYVRPVCRMVDSRREGIRRTIDLVVETWEPVE